MFNVMSPPPPQPQAPPVDPNKPDPAAKSPAAAHGAVSEEEALKGGAHAKMTQFTISDPSKPGGGAQPIGSTSVTVGGLIQGKVAVDLMDALLPALLVVLAAKFQLEVRKTQLQLTAGEKATLAPLVDAWLNSISLNFDSPGIALSVTLLAIYGGKAIEVFGVGFLDKKAGEGPATPAASMPRKETPVVPFRGPVDPAPASANNDGFADPAKTQGPPTWTENDVKLWMKKKKWSRVRVEEWLQKTWVKQTGGVI